VQFESGICLFLFFLFLVVKIVMQDEHLCIDRIFPNHIPASCYLWAQPLHLITRQRGSDLQNSAMWFDHQMWLFGLLNMTWSLGCISLYRIYTLWVYSPSSHFLKVQVKKSGKSGTCCHKQALRGTIEGQLKSVSTFVYL